MDHRIRIRPSKTMSILGAVVGLGLIATMASFFLLGPAIGVGLFVVVWVLTAVGLIGYHAYNAFSGKGLATGIIDVESDERAPKPEDDFETKLRKLERLRDDRLITQDEYERKRAEILEAKW